MQPSYKTTKPASVDQTFPTEMKNFLFIIPDELSPLENAILAVTIGRMAHYGYVYVADVQQHHVEDRDCARYMPLRNDAMPCFGRIDSVLIFHDGDYETPARKSYPDARIMIFNPTAGDSWLEHELLLKAA